MSSPQPHILNRMLKHDAGHATKEQVEEMYKSGYRKFIEGLSVQNAKVRYYCNKTLTMRQPLYDILDDLISVQQKAMAYLPQHPETLDHYVLSMIFTLIEKTTSMINWNLLNRKCFWNDFCRETRQLRFLINQAQLATFECTHTIVDKANRAKEVLQSLTVDEKKEEQKESSNLRLIDTRVQTQGVPTLTGIRVLCVEPRETVIVEWIDIDSEEHQMQSVKLIQTCDSFRLRFLRSLIFCARKKLEHIILTMSRVDIALRTEFPLEKLKKCEGLTEMQILPHERAVLFKAKREFDRMWGDILGTICRFRVQLEQLNPHVKMLSRLVKDPQIVSHFIPNVDSISIHIEDPLLLDIVSQALMEEVNNESYTFTMYTDRTEDISDIVGDIWSIDKTSYKSMDMLTMLIYSALSHLNDTLNKEEKKELRNNLGDIFVQRDRIKRYLKKGLAVFNHNAFNELPIHQPIPSNSSPTVTTSRTTASISGEDSDSESDDDNDEEGRAQALLWVHLPGGFDVTIGENKEFLVVNHFKDQSQFSQLDEEQQVNLTNKMISRLFHFVAAESCFAKILHERCVETKSLMKRLKPRDRMGKELITNIAHGISHLKHLLRLMKTMNALKKFSEKP